MDKFVVKKPRAAVEEEIEMEEENVDETETGTVKRNRKIRVEWLKKFPWLQNKNGTAFCKACNKSAVNILSHLNRRENCSAHLQNIEARRSQISIHSFIDAKKEQMSKMGEKRKTHDCYVFDSTQLTFLLMDVSPDLLTECCPDSEVGKRLKCARTKATKITEDISNATTKDLISSLKSCKFSIIIDETTDVSTKKCLVLVVRYVASLIVCDRFLALIELLKCDEASVFGVIKNFFVNNNIPLKNIIGLATDGASVMAGHLSGVKALFEAETNIFYLKCTCHSLHLCVSYACKKLPGDVDWLCRNIYSFFSHSPKRVHDFKEFLDYCTVKPHKILGISYTRWLSLKGVVSRLIEQWDALKLFY